jgi:HK97 family phage prohead protease
MERLYKSFELKEGENGVVEGYASTWTKTPDSYGDIVIKGAFEEALKKRKATGHPFPLCFNHDFDQIIGAVFEAYEDDYGLKIRASFLNTPAAQEKRELVKEGIVWQFSFAYSILGAEEPTEEEQKQGIFQKLTKLDLYEVSLVPVPANQTAVVTEVKNDDDVETKSGKRNSAKDEALIRDAISALQALLDTADDQGEDESEANGAPEEQKASNPEKDALLTYIKSMEE